MRVSHVVCDVSPRKWAAYSRMRAARSSGWTKPCQPGIDGPAAKEDVITHHNAKNIQAKLIVEGANGPTSSKADSIIHEKGISVVPDILANAGGVTVSYFEWVQNRLGYKWTADRVNRRSDRIMKDAFNNVFAVSLEYKVSMRIAAYMVAIDKVAKTYKFRGGF